LQLKNHTNDARTHEYQMSASICLLFSFLRENSIQTFILHYQQQITSEDSWFTF